MAASADRAKLPGPSRALLFFPGEGPPPTATGMLAPEVNRDNAGVTLLPVSVVGLNCTVARVEPEPTLAPGIKRVSTGGPFVEAEKALRIEDVPEGRFEDRLIKGAPAAVEPILVKSPVVETLAAPLGDVAPPVATVTPGLEPIVLVLRPGFGPATAATARLTGAVELPADLTTLAELGTLTFKGGASTPVFGRAELLPPAVF